MRVEFVVSENGPERLVAEAAVVFGEGPLAGTKLVGFSVWRGADGELYVTFPARAFGAGAERKFFDYLRSTDGTGDAIRRVKAFLLDAWRARQEEAA
jgi:hypothetical protein